jgi:transcriptional regulator with XRE-family HTH domain
VGKRTTPKRPNDPDVVALGVIIRNARLQTDLTQEQLAELSGVGRQRIIDIENGKASDIRLATLRSLAKPLGLKVSVLLKQ